MASDVADKAGFTARHQRLVEATESLERPPIDPARTALVVVDMVEHQTNPDTGMLAEMRTAGVDVDYLVSRVRELVTPNLRQLIDACHETDARVVYLVFGSARDDYDDAVPATRWALERVGARVGRQACAIVPEIAPTGNDLVLHKTGTGGFTSGALDNALRNMGVEHVLYAGVVTHGCVLATATAGFDLGYFGYLVTDATATFSTRLQENAEEILGGYFAVTTNTAASVSALKVSRGDSPEQHTPSIEEDVSDGF